MSPTGRVIVAKLTCKTTWAGILVLIYQGFAKLELIRPSKVSPLLEMITAGLCFRIQDFVETVRNRLISYRSLSIEILFKT